MDNQKQDSSEKKIIQPAKSTNSSLLKTISIGLGVIGIGLAIGIGGYLLGSNKTKTQNIQNNSLSIVPTVVQPSEMPDETANWQTYSNKYYSFKYPLDWDVAQLDSSLAITSLIVAPKVNIDALRKVNFQVGGSKDSVITILGPSSDSSAPPFTLVSDTTKSVTSKTLIIAGLKSTEYTSIYEIDLPGVQAGDIAINSIVKNDSENYSLGLLDMKYENIYYQILSTFKFTQ